MYFLYYHNVIVNIIHVNYMYLLNKLFDTESNHLPLGSYYTECIQEIYSDSVTRQGSFDLPDTVCIVRVVCRVVR